VKCAQADEPLIHRQGQMTPPWMTQVVRSLPLPACGACLAPGKTLRDTSVEEHDQEAADQQQISVCIAVSKP
jgi:hypothetical protein